MIICQICDKLVKEVHPCSFLFLPYCNTDTPLNSNFPKTIRENTKHCKCTYYFWNMNYCDIYCTKSLLRGRPLRATRRFCGCLKNALNYKSLVIPWRGEGVTGAEISFHRGEVTFHCGQVFSTGEIKLIIPWGTPSPLLVLL